ncbi:MAG: IS3 family transposase [Desulfobulbaceae bacterium]|nr:IS3 family transposase [Desulfobulbaceae bacterium]
MKRKRKKYTQEFKEEAVKLITEQGYKITEAARNLGVDGNMLGRWKREIEGGGDDVSGLQGGTAMQAELNRLRKENKRLKMEREILKKGSGLLRERNELKYQFVDAEKKSYPIALICAVIRISRSGYYAWRKRDKSLRQRENDRLIPIVKAAHKKSKETYGTRRIAEEIKAHGINCGRTRAGTLMKLADVVAKQKKKFKATTDSKHNLPVAPNLLDRQFEVQEQDKVYVGDITYLWTQEGWLYLAVVLDLFSRQIVGWSMSNRMTKKLVMDALRMAIWRRRPAPGLIFHTDRGSQYCSNDFQKLLKAHGMVSSMSRKGNCWDNAVVESFFGSLKTERVFFSNYATREAAKSDVVDYIEMFYNSHRRHSYLGYVSPKEFEKMWFLKKAA